MRSLARIERISKLTPIPNSDNIEVAKVLGWDIVVKRGEFKSGDEAVYIEIDTLLPKDNPIFSFMEKYNWRVKTVKIRGQISQGLLLPISKFNFKESFGLGQDLTNILNLSKYESDDDLLIEEKSKKSNKFVTFLFDFYIIRKMVLPFIKKETKDSYPYWITKTDEERIQNCFNRLHYHLNSRINNKIFEVTEKLEGTSCTFFIKWNDKRSFFGNKYIFGVCSRNQWIKTPNNSHYWKMARKYNLEKVLSSRKNHENIVIQGEIVGPGVQKNIYKLNENRFYVFTVIINGTHLTYKEMIDFCKDTGLAIVPLVNDSYEFPDDVKDIVQYSIGKSLIAKDVDREGLVFRKFDYMKNKTSFKSINPEYLLKS